MSAILHALQGIPQSRERNDDDGFDRLSHRYTSAVLIMFAVFMTSTQFVGNKITCWVPAHFTDSHQAYTNNYCWVKNTYYLPFEDYVPHEEERHLRHMITYYQWIPLILLAQAFLFFFPCQVWRWFNVRSGIDVNDIVEAGQTFHKTETVDKKDAKLEAMVSQMDRYLIGRPYYNRNTTVSVSWLLSKVLFPCSKRSKGNFLVVLYILVKLIYLGNVVGQLFILDALMNHSFSFYGIYVIKHLISGTDWMASPRFPRVTMCDFKLRRMGSNIQRYTVQCTLPHNIFNEKIFLFMWFWMVVVGLFTLYGLIRWIIKFINTSDHHRYIRKHLVSGGSLEVIPEEHIKRKCARFVNKYLRADGVFCLQLVDYNTDIITANEFICALWQRYKEKPEVPTQGNFIYPTTDVDPSDVKESMM